MRISVAARGTSVTYHIFSYLLQMSMLCLAVVITASSVHGQAAVANLVGTVTDESKAAMPGAQVTVVNRSTGSKRRTVTDTSGDYTVSQLLPGFYDVVVDAKGFGKTTVTDVELQVQQTARIDVVLKVGSVTQTVEVSGRAPLLQTEEASVGDVIDQKRIVAMPLNGRSFLQLAYLVPGVMQVNPNSQTNTQRGTAYGDSAISIGGNRENANIFLLDGTINQDRNFNTFAISPPVDAIQEFKVEINSYSPEFGGQGGGVINVITKSGSNSLHGSGWGFFRNSALDAKNFFDRPNQPIPQFSQQQFGMTAGGRIIRDKLFWFGSYEGLRQGKAQTSLGVTPNAALRAGDFSNYRDSSGKLITIYDPATTRPCATCITGYTRDPFPGNIIPANRINSVSAGLLKYIDLPNQSTALPFDTGYFFNNFPHQEHDDQTTDRIDYILSESDHLFGRYSFTNEHVLVPGAFTNQTTNNLPAAQNLTLAESHVFSATEVNDFRFGAVRFKNDVFTGNANKNDVAASLGIQGASAITGDPNRWGVPTIDLSGSGIGWGDYGTTSQRDNSFDFVDTFNLVHGRNNLRFGGEFIRDQLNQKVIGYSSGFFNFSGQFTQLPDSAGITGSSIADYLLGDPFEQLMPSGNFQVYLRRWQMALYANDDVKVTPNLTLNIGLRWDYIQPWVEKYNHFSMVGTFSAYGGPEPVFLPAGGKPLAIGGNGQPLAINPITGQPCTQCPNVSRGIILPDRHDFMPRFGLAWRPFGSTKWAVRMGGGVFFDTQIANTVVDYARNPPYTSAAYVSVPNFYIPSQSISDFVSPPPGHIAAGGWGTTVNFPRAHIGEYNFSIQRQLSSSTAITVQYLGSMSRKLSVSGTGNQYLSNPDACKIYSSVCEANNGVVPVAQRLIFQNVPAECCQTALPFVNANYNAGVVMLQRRFSDGLSVLSSYTYAKSIDNGNEIRGGGYSDYSNYYRVGKDFRGVSDFDQTHRFVTSWVWELPIGKRKKFLSGVSKGVDYFVGGWSVNGIYTVASGLPFYVHGGSTPWSLIPNIIGDPTLPRSQRSVNEWFNPKVYVPIPPNGDIGNGGRNNLRAPGLNDWDFGIDKDIPVSDRWGYFQIRGEFFNAFNHPSFGIPNASFGSSSLGRITSANDPRIIQLGVKYIF